MNKSAIGICSEIRGKFDFENVIYHHSHALIFFIIIWKLIWCTTSMMYNTHFIYCTIFPFLTHCAIVHWTRFYYLCIYSGYEMQSVYLFWFSSEYTYLSSSLDSILFSILIMKCKILAYLFILIVNWLLRYCTLWRRDVSLILEIIWKLKCI